MAWYVFLGWGWEVWGDTGGADTDGKHSTTNGKGPETISGPRNRRLPEEGPGRPSQSLAQSGQRSPEDAAARPGASPGAPGAEEGLQAGGVTGWCLLGVLRRLGARSWGPGAGPVLTMPGRSAYLGSAMAAARRGWGTGDSAEPGPVFG